MHLKNESAAKCFGSNPAWCVTYGHWDRYSDNFLYICDTDGYRYGINLRENQCVDQNDLAVPLEDLFEKFDGLKEHVQGFYRKQLNNAVERNDLKNCADLMLSWQQFRYIGNKKIGEFVLTSFDPQDIKDATLSVSKKTHSRWIENLFNSYLQSEKTRDYFKEHELIRLPFELYRRKLITDSTIVNGMVITANESFDGALESIIQEEISSLANSGNINYSIVNGVMRHTNIKSILKPKI